MADGTLIGRTLEDALYVTVLALESCVHTVEGESCLEMIESNVLFGRLRRGRLRRGRSRRAGQGEAEQQQGAEEAETECVEDMFCNECLHDGAFFFRVLVTLPIYRALPLQNKIIVRCRT